MSKFKKQKCKYCKRTKECKNGFCSSYCKHRYEVEEEKKWSYRGPSKKGYICRVLTTKNKTGDAYGLTLPRVLVEKYDLLGKIFKVDVKKSGVFVLKTKIEYVEAK